MKFTGLPLTVVQACIADHNLSAPVIAGSIPRLVWNHKNTYPDGSIYGYLSTKGMPKAAHGWAVRAGAPINYPCVHVQVRFVQRVFKAIAPKVTGVKAAIEKHNVTPHLLTSLPKKTTSKIRAAVAARKEKPFTCVCGGLDSIPEVNGVAPKWADVIDTAPNAPESESKPTSGPSLYPDMAPLDGEPLEPGEDAKWKEYMRRDLVPAVTSLYVLQECENALRDPEVMSRLGIGFNREDGTLVHHRSGFLADKTYRKVKGFLTFKRDFETRLARNMLDYLTMACVGELRHAPSHGIPATIDGGQPKGRKDAYLRAFEYDPRTILPVCAEVFGGFSWGGSYGGSKWANIAKSAGYFFKFRAFPLVFADHVVDLMHNGGCAFDKGYIIYSDDTSTLQSILNVKRDGSLLGAKMTLQLEHDVAPWVTTIRELTAIPGHESVGAPLCGNRAPTWLDRIRYCGQAEGHTGDCTLTVDHDTRRRQRGFCGQANLKPAPEAPRYCPLPEGHEGDCDYAVGAVPYPDMRWVPGKELLPTRAKIQVIQRVHVATMKWGTKVFKVTQGTVSSSYCAESNPLTNGRLVTYPDKRGG